MTTITCTQCGWVARTKQRSKQTVTTSECPTCGVYTVMRIDSPPDAGPRGRCVEPAQETD